MEDAMKAMQSAAGSPPAAWPASEVHRGYDTMEFAPQDCGRDFPQAMMRRRRIRVRDEEQALLRRVAAEFSANNSVHEVAVEDMEDDQAVGDGSSRLYRD